MKAAILSSILLIPSMASAQEQQRLLLGSSLDGGAMTLSAEPSRHFPDYGYVVYDDTGKPVKAFGPNTPVQPSNGVLEIIGGDFPRDWTVKTEDAPTYLSVLASTSGADAPPESNYTQEIRELVNSINEGASYLKDSLCDHPARPLTIKVEIEGGFNVFAYGGLKTTVDWDLEQMCTNSSTTAQR